MKRRIRPFDRQPTKHEAVLVLVEDTLRLGVWIPCKVGPDKKYGWYANVLAPLGDGKTLYTGVRHYCEFFEFDIDLLNRKVKIDSKLRGQCITELIIQPFPKETSHA